MALIERTGAYGQYWGDTMDSSHSLTQSQMEINATYIYGYLNNYGWTVNAIAGLLGNMQHESAINPGRWEGNNVGSGPGYGLVQWTPYTKYTTWATAAGYSDYSEMDPNLARIIYELENGIQYIPTSGYPESFQEFAESDQTPYYLACAFAWNYERSAVVLWGTEAEKEALRRRRGGSANAWYKYLTGIDPPSPAPSKKKKEGYKFVLFNKRRRIYG